LVLKEEQKVSQIFLKRNFIPWAGSIDNEAPYCRYCQTPCHELRACPHKSEQYESYSPRAAEAITKRKARSTAPLLPASGKN
jgi:hypothetical protein